MNNLHIKIPDCVTPDLAYLCGVFAGDGNISIRFSKKEYSLKCVGNPLDEKEFYSGVVGPLFENVFGIFPNMRLYDSETTFGFRIYSKDLVLFFTKFIGLPFGKKYNSICVPEIFLEDNLLVAGFIRGIFDTDGCICFKKKYKKVPYYPVISFSSKSELLTKQISKILKEKGFSVVEIYNYGLNDVRFKSGFSIINKLELNGQKNFLLWMEIFGFYSPKHLKKIALYSKEKK